MWLTISPWFYFSVGPRPQKKISIVSSSSPLYMDIYLSISRRCGILQSTLLGSSVLVGVLSAYVFPSTFPSFASLLGLCPPKNTLILLSLSLLYMDLYLFVFEQYGTLQSIPLEANVLVVTFPIKDSILIPFYNDQTLHSILFNSYLIPFYRPNSLHYFFVRKNKENKENIGTCLIFYLKEKKHREYKK